MSDEERQNNQRDYANYGNSQCNNLSSNPVLKKKKTTGALSSTLVRQRNYNSWILEGMVCAQYAHMLFFYATGCTVSHKYILKHNRNSWTGHQQNIINVVNKSSALPFCGCQILLSNIILWHFALEQVLAAELLNTPSSSSPRPSSSHPYLCFFSPCLIPSWQLILARQFMCSSQLFFTNMTVNWNIKPDDTQITDNCEHAVKEFLFLLSHVLQFSHSQLTLSEMSSMQ